MFQFSLHQGFNRRTDTVYNRHQVCRRWAIWVHQGVNGGLNRTTVTMTKNHNDRTVITLSSKLNTANLRRCNHISSNTNNKQITQTLVKYHFCRHTRIRTSEYNGKWVLVFRHLCSFLVRQLLMVGCLTRYKTLVTLF